jgi:signal transduction histidine kinase/HAMP domain-containing protein
LLGRRKPSGASTDHREDQLDQQLLLAANEALEAELARVGLATTDLQRVIGAVADGDLSKKITADVDGEFLDLKNTVNAMVDQLNGFSSEVTRVAREVGVEGKLGGQAQSAEIGGVWKDLTDNVNQLAANLTNQVRAIADVATAVTEGDLTRQVSVEASGEVAVLREKLNQMIRNLRETTRQNDEQNWLKTNLERFSRMLQGQRDLATVSSAILSELAPLVSAQHGVFYALTGLEDDGDPVLIYQAGYGFKERKHLSARFRLGEGLVGQCALEKERILLTDVPGDYIQINSGLGSATPLNIIVLPIVFEGSVRAVVELASFSPFSATHQAFLDQLVEIIGVALNTIEANTLTENLLKQSQSQAQELQARQEELSSSNEDLGEKAEQLAVSSRYKSEFFSNMSHELRTPLNSLLILAGELADNSGGNLTDEQVEYASSIRSSGSDLLLLLNDVLDLAKVESGTVTLASAEVPLAELEESIRREFEPVAAKQGLLLAVEIAPELPPTLTADANRLRQVLKNLLSNALKFTDAGSVRLRIGPPADGWSPGREELRSGVPTIAFAVTDTGIGIAADKHETVFEAFAQADGTASRSYGGTGLGLSISRELVAMMGGEIGLESTPGAGSTFTVYLPNPPSTAPAVAPVPQATSPVAEIPAAVTEEPIAPLQPPAEPAGSGLAGMKVLVVDDDFRNIFALTSLLKRVEIAVVSAESGETGIAALAETPDVDLVLVDIMMPGMDGYATMRAMRALPGKGDLPLVAFTAKVEAGERQRCIDAGASSYVSKPVDTAQLLAVLGEWLPAAPRLRS